MPSLRRRGQPSPSPQEVFSESDGDYVSAAGSNSDQEQEQGFEEEIEQELLSDEEQAGLLSPGSEPSEPPLSPSHFSAALPPDFREISTLASWTVSSSKPGCSVPQLRHPSPSLFWQSDGPQPHYLNVHFFKLVRIVGLRLYLDFEQDESYTPTRIVLLAGSGMNDLVEWGEMRLENPRGWVWADFSGVGDPDDDEDDDEEEGDGLHTGLPDAGVPTPHWHAGNDAPTDDVSDFENAAPRTAPAAAAPLVPLNTHAGADGTHPIPPQAQPATPVPLAPQTQTQPTSSLQRTHPRAPFANISPDAAPPSTPAAPAMTRAQKMPTLRCHLVQIKILENHQNGKDTHLRGLQIFARDERRGAGGGGGGATEPVGMAEGLGRGKKDKGRRREGGLAGGGWMEEVVIR